MIQWLGRSALLVTTLLLLILLWTFNIFRNSLPVLDGDVYVNGITSSVTVERDSVGVPIISGSNRSDVAFATGYLHAQERFFQMDLGRRNSAGELSALVGSVALEHDKRQRKHRFRQVAHQSSALLSESHRQILDAYTNGVNTGLSDLDSKPFEYWLLSIEPEPWVKEDTFLTVFSMYMDLNDDAAKLDNAKGFLDQVVSNSVIDFLSPLSTRWDSPLIADELEVPPLPDETQVNLRSKPAAFYSSLNGSLIEDAAIGSNSWAVSGKLTDHGGAIVENDMHLNHRVPNVWYRAQLRYPDPESNKDIRITGVSLPGTPIVVVGSNTDVAWGFTNSNGDWVDLVALELEGNVYQTPQGPESLYTWSETIAIKGQESVIVDYQGTRWGPVVQSSYDDRQYALRWTAHDPAATNLNLINLESVGNVESAMAVANTSGIPPQNFTVGDRHGSIGWTIAGRIPSRIDIDSTLPLPWDRADQHWKSWLAAEDYPSVVNPISNRIWTANARVASGNDYRKLGNGGYAAGPRQQQIRDALMATEIADEKGMLEIALDDRALYMNNWRELIISTLSEPVRNAEPARQVFYDHVKQWSGKAATDDVGYRLVREFNDAVSLKILQSLGRYFLSLSGYANSNVNDSWLQKLNHEEEMIWRLLDERPMNWLSSKYESWDELFIEAIDEVTQALGGKDQLANATWGERNKAKVNHPLSGSIPIFGQLLNMPSVPLAGDIWMPKAQKPSAGISERIVVSPGREDKAIFHMPGGQSGHPLSFFYQLGYMDWAEGRETPFFPQEIEYRLTLQPGS